MIAPGAVQELHATVVTPTFLSPVMLVEDAAATVDEMISRLVTEATAEIRDEFKRISQARSVRYAFGLVKKFKDDEARVTEQIKTLPTTVNLAKYTLESYRGLLFDAFSRINPRADASEITSAVAELVDPALAALADGAPKKGKKSSAGSSS